MKQIEGERHLGFDWVKCRAIGIATLTNQPKVFETNVLV